MKRKKEFTIEEALLAKPTSLGNVEPVLQKAPFRELDWRDQSADRHPESSFANSWIAIRGWIIDEYKFVDSEGPEFTINYAYQIGDKTFLGLFEASYDGMHWPISSPDHWEWFRITIRKGNAFTVLVNPANHSNSMVFGQMEAFLIIDGGLKWIAW